MISDNYEKMREQRCWTAFVVLRHRSVRLPDVIAISLVSVGRTDRLAAVDGTTAWGLALLPLRGTCAALFDSTVTETLMGLMTNGAFCTSCSSSCVGARASEQL